MAVFELLARSTPARLVAAELRRCPGLRRSWSRWGFSSGLAFPRNETPLGSVEDRGSAGEFSLKSNDLAFPILQPLSQSGKVLADEGGELLVDHPGETATHGDAGSFAVATPGRPYRLRYWHLDQLHPLVMVHLGEDPLIDLGKSLSVQTSLRTTGVY